MIGTCRWRNEQSREDNGDNQEPRDASLAEPRESVSEVDAISLEEVKIQSDEPSTPPEPNFWTDSEAEYTWISV